MYDIKVLTPPAGYPTSISEFKTYRKLNNGSTEDTILTKMMESAIAKFQDRSGLILYTTSLRQHLDEWPCDWSHRARCDFTFMLPICKYPVQSIESVHYYSITNVDTTLTGYETCLVTNPALVILDTFPALSRRKKPPIWVDFTAGYTAGNCPSAIQVAVYGLMSFMYDHREAFEAGVLRDVPEGFTNTINQFRTGFVGRDH